MDNNYRLWAMRADEQGIKAAASTRFARVTPEYVLLYVPGIEIFDNAVEVKAEDLHRLTSRDQTWLFNCAAALAIERIKDKSDAIAADLGKMVDDFAAELEKESKGNVNG